MSDTHIYNQEAEQALIGSLLYDPGLIDTIDLEPGELYVDRHKRVFSAIRNLHAKGVDADLVTLTDLFERDGVLAEMGGAAWLTGLLLGVPNTQSIQSYARVVRDYATRRRMVAIAGELVRAALDTAAATDGPVSVALDGLAMAATRRSGAAHLSVFTAQVAAEVEAAMARPADVWGIPTGFADIDDMLGGLQPGEVFYLAGEPGIGKSKLMLDMALRMGRGGAAGAIFSLEMSGRAMAYRAVSVAGKVPTRLLKSGKLAGDDLAAYRRGLTEIDDLPVYLSDDAGLTAAGLRAELSRLIGRHGIRWFALDYLLLMSGYDHLEETERSAKLSAAVKRVARDLSLAALTVNSVTKDGMSGGAPKTSNLRGSGQVAHDADLVAFLVKDDSQPNIVRLIFTKTRDVADGIHSIDLYARPDYPAFGNVAPYDLNGGA